MPTDLYIIGSGNGLVPSHYLNKYRLIYKWTPPTKGLTEIQIKLWKFSCKKNAFENVTCKMSVVLIMPFYVNYVIL